MDSCHIFRRNGRLDWLMVGSFDSEPSPGMYVAISRRDTHKHSNIFAADDVGNGGSPIKIRRQTVDFSAERSIPDARKELVATKINDENFVGSNIKCRRNGPEIESERANQKKVKLTDDKKQYILFQIKCTNESQKSMWCL